jgi:hypothetical protein
VRPHIDTEKSLSCSLRVRRIRTSKVLPTTVAQQAAAHERSQSAFARLVLQVPDTHPPASVPSVSGRHSQSYTEAGSLDRSCFESTEVVLTADGAPHLPVLGRRGQLLEYRLSTSDVPSDHAPLCFVEGRTQAVDHAVRSHAHFAVHLQASGRQLSYHPCANPLCMDDVPFSMSTWHGPANWSRIRCDRPQSSLLSHTSVRSVLGLNKDTAD